MFVIQVCMVKNYQVMVIVVDCVGVVKVVQCMDNVGFYMVKVSEMKVWMVFSVKNVLGKVMEVVQSNVGV